MALKGLTLIALASEGASLDIDTTTADLSASQLRQIAESQAKFEGKLVLRNIRFNQNDLTPIVKANPGNVTLVV